MPTTTMGPGSGLGLELMLDTTQDTLLSQSEPVEHCK